EVEERDLDTASTGDNDTGDLAPGSVTGSTPNDTGETDSGALTFSAGSDALTTFTFGATDDIEISGLLGSPTITWSSSGTDTLIGQINGVDAIILKVTGSTIAAGGSGDVTVKATLTDNFPHALGAGTIQIDGIAVNAAQADGDFATGEVSLQVLD